MEINQSISKHKVNPQLLLVAKHARTAHCLGPAMRCLMQFSQGSGTSSPQSRKCKEKTIYDRARVILKYLTRTRHETFVVTQNKNQNPTEKVLTSSSA